MRLPRLAPPLLICALLLASASSAQDLTGSGSSPDGTRVQPSTTERIDRHNVCREVTNNTVSPIMVPHRSPTEWAVGGAAFLGNPYPNVIVGPCSSVVVPDPDPPAPEYEPLTSGGGVSTTNENHPVFQLFQSCFQVPPGAYINFPNACTLDETFWDSFETAACAPSPHGLTITMGGFALGNSGSACAEVGFDEFIGRAKVSTCEPASCGINENGPSSCTFRCE